MGDFSVSCVLTGVTIHARPAALIPLAPAEYSNRQRPGFDEHHGVSVVTNEGAAGIFAPLTLPILGSTDSYGTLETVEEDEHTAFLCKRLGCTLDELIDSVCRGQGLPGFAKLARQSRRGETKKRYHWSGTPWGCFVARAAWDEFSVACWDESGKADTTVWDDGWLDPQNLKGMGFTKGKQDRARAEEIFGKGPHEGDRYNVPYTHPELPGFTVWCDGHMSSRCEKGGKKFGVKKRYGGKSYESDIYKVGDLAKALEQQGACLPHAAEAWARKTPTYYGKLMEAKQNYLRAKRMDKDSRKRLIEDPSGHFKMVSDSTPAEEAARQREWFKARMEHFLKSKDDGEAPPDPGPFVPRVIMVPHVKPPSIRPEDTIYKPEQVEEFLRYRALFEEAFGPAEDQHSREKLYSKWETRGASHRETRGVELIHDIRNRPLVCVTNGALYTIFDRPKFSAEALLAEVRAKLVTEFRVDENEPTEVPLVVTQVFCDRSYHRKGTMHITLRGHAAGADAFSFEVSPCPDTGDNPYMSTPCPGIGGEDKLSTAIPLKFPAEVWSTLAERGWKPPRSFSFRHGGNADPYVRCFSPEMRRLYGVKLYTTFLPRVIETLTFLRNMHAANRLLQPTDGGWQYGNYPTQKRVAQCAARIVDEKLRKDAEYRRKHG